jgi:hypothetical protein
LPNLCLRPSREWCQQRNGSGAGGRWGRSKLAFLTGEVVRRGALQQLPSHQRATPPSRIMLNGAGLRPDSAILRYQSVCTERAKVHLGGADFRPPTDVGPTSAATARATISICRYGMLFLTVLPGSRSISRLPLILTRYGRKQGNGGTRNAGVIHAATWEPSRPLDGSFSRCSASASARRLTVC